MRQKTWEVIETLAHGYSSESSQRKQSDEYQHDRVEIVFKYLCILELWYKVSSALERVKQLFIHSIVVCFSPLRVQSSPGPRSTAETPAQSIRPVTAAGLPTATVTTTPAASTAPAATPGAPVADRTSSRSQIQLSDLQTILSGMAGKCFWVSEEVYLQLLSTVQCPGWLLMPKIVCFN